VTAETDYSLWKVTKRLKQPTECILSIKNADKIRAQSDKGKGNTIFQATKQSLSNRAQQSSERTSINNTTNKIPYTKGNHDT
jgi:hypothetical protein